ncbi:uncharacterized protein MONBRDRAFT_7101 [Monosiga brevicollis MX1]|uniref:Checkpoint protein n=1 Tax=Monosiga brevicollis TaxID=81824 RepID=A9UVX5_MONBE|nr:uncharacterized protein MONBRDRAFT_7101 [Monosiga brevicollis MX1]EDQ90467.1 predicted protein [Monosiga brevicollis MX1]|eukprot:XP_001744518.1 hypothetical protein [Monosiga brevicollis MX1]
MRFRSTFANYGAVMVFEQTLTCFQRASKARMVGVRFCEDKVVLQPTQLDFRRDANLWAEMPRNELFSEFVLDSKHPEKQIMVELRLELLIKAFSSTKDARSVHMRLRKQGSEAYLAVRIGVLTTTGAVRQIQQDVPIQVFPSTAIADYPVPNVPPSQVHIFLPDPRRLRLILERMKTFSNEITIQANGQGELLLQSASEMVSISTTYHGLTNPARKDQDDGASDAPTASQPAAFERATVDTAKVQAFIQGALQMSATPHLLMTLHG